MADISELSDEELVPKKGSFLEWIGMNSSIGDVKTLRSQLHARRTTLNEEIGKEDHILQGSKKLVGASLDHKTKDQASLEMSFAESKIKALQAELAKINSSLHAYQDESAQGTQVPLIPLAMKTTSSVSFVSSFSEIISKHYHTDPATVQEKIYEFQELRNSLSNASRDEAGIKLLHEYYNQLQLVSKRFIHPSMKHGLAFIWYDAINGMPAAQQSVIFEKACIVFNLGALYTQLAAKVDRSKPASIDTAIHHLERAIGVFEYMKQKFSNSPTMDMSTEVLALSSDLMRAQAQELLWEKTVMEGLKKDLSSLIDYAHRTKSVAECYKPVRELVDEDTLKEYLPGCWITLIKVKDAHYKALAHYYAAVVHGILADTFNNGGKIPEDVRTELIFLYLNTGQEQLTDHSPSEPKYHIGLMQSHLNCAMLSHEYAVKYNSVCRDLHHIAPLTRMLSEANARTKAKKEAADTMAGVTVIAPTIQPSEISLRAVPPDFSKVWVQDMFRSLGPLPVFSAENKWTPPRTVTLKRGKSGFGFMIRNSRPVIFSGVDKGGPAEVAGIKPKDWLLSVNGVNTKFMSHGEVVSMVKECKEEVTFELTTPEWEQQQNGSPEGTL